MAFREAIASLELQPSEAAVLAAASRILAAHIAAGRLQEANAEELMEASLRMAIALALRTDALLDAEEERSAPPRTPGPLG